jgi:D-aminopeptidase
MKGKVAYIVADLEGSTGAWTKAHTLLGTPQWQKARVELTRDINAVTEALFEMGVKGVVVKDFHRTGYNLIPRYLDRRVKTVCEAELFATVLSAFQVPVCFFSGCPAACQEVKQKMEWVVTYAIAKDPEIYQDERRWRDYIIQKRQGLRGKINEISNPEAIPLFFMKPPFNCQVIFQEEAEARCMNPWGFLQDGRTVSFHAEHFLELYQNLLKIAYFPKVAYQLRSLVLPMTRFIWKIQSLKHL